MLDLASTSTRFMAVMIEAWCMSVSSGLPSLVSSFSGPSSTECQAPGFHEPHHPFPIDTFFPSSRWVDGCSDELLDFKSSFSLSSLATSPSSPLPVSATRSGSPPSKLCLASTTPDRVLVPGRTGLVSSLTPSLHYPSCSPAENPYCQSSPVYHTTTSTFFIDGWVILSCCNLSSILSDGASSKSNYTNLNHQSRPNGLNKPT
jgi:hypothetical protein